MNLKHSCHLFLLIMTFGELLNEHSEQGKKIVRQIESTERKIINAKLAVVFNQECIKNNLLPKFTNIYIYIYIYSLQAALMRHNHNVIETERVQVHAAVKTLYYNSAIQ